MKRLRKYDLLYDEVNQEQGTLGEYLGFYGLIVSCITGTIFTLFQF